MAMLVQYVMSEDLGQELLVYHWFIICRVICLSLVYHQFLFEMILGGNSLATRLISRLFSPGVLTLSCPGEKRSWRV